MITGKEIYVMSDEIIPYDMKKGTAIFIIDKFAVVIADGENKVWNKNGTAVEAGQPWSACC